MSFKTTMGLGLSAVLLLVVYQAMAAIIVALTIAFWWALGIGTGVVLFVGVAYWKREEDSRLRFVDGASGRDLLPPYEHALPVTAQERM